MAYVGDRACADCHQEKSASYHRTAHATTSSPGTKDSIKGKFNPGSNTLRTANPDLYFQMEAGATGFLQRAIVRTSPTEVLTRAERIDLVIGSGRKGQTYLFWDGDALFQLPISYWTERDAWVNSPGYIDGRADFERPIPARCLECHGSSFESRAPPPGSYNRASLVLGISCEKCHGPGSEHVAQYRAISSTVPRSTTAIVNPKKLSRERQIDVCALCHAGAGNSLTPPLSFTPGNDLAKHLAFPKLPQDARLDVHASQVQLLERSRCFQSSPTMTCTTCHDVHQPQRDLAAFAVRCLSCHQAESCGAFPKQGHAIDRQCVTCHMPAQATDQIVIAALGGKSMQPKVRNHQIAIYPEVRTP
ncbi:MAG: multiheme c-type cytochrome [Opitutaceae bacterium]